MRRLEGWLVSLIMNVLTPSFETQLCCSSG